MRGENEVVNIKVLVIESTERSILLIHRMSRLPGMVLVDLNPEKDLCYYKISSSIVPLNKKVICHSLSYKAPITPLIQNEVSWPSCHQRA